jgi:biopolymer transport protein ExbB
MMELLQKGGPVAWLLLAASVVALMIFLERFLHLHRVQIKSESFLTGIFTILKKQNIVEAVSICDETPGPVPRVVRAALLHYDEGRDNILRAVESTGLEEIPRLERNLSMLATIAHLAPLLGLLGSVLGLMKLMVLFDQKAPLIHAGDLAGGIWQALITTALGLMVSIPAYAAYNFLVGRVESVALDMERAASEIVAFLTVKSVQGKSK